MQNIFETAAPFPYHIYEKRLSTLASVAKKKITHYFYFPIRFVQLSLLFVLSQFFALFLIKEALLIGLLLGLFFMTLFSFIILCQVMYKKAHSKSCILLEQFLQQCKQLANSLQDPLAEHLLAIQGLDLLCNQLTIDASFFPNWLKSLEQFAEPILVKYKTRFLYHIVHQLLQLKVQKIIALIAIVPNEMSFHAKLALCLMQQAQHFELHQEKLQEYQAYQKAINELLIVENYLADKAWVLEKLAFCYEKMQEVVPLIEVLEKLHFLDPRNKTILKKLAILYFRFKQQAKGLEIYEKLRQDDPSLSEEIIQHYSNQL